MADDNPDTAKMFAGIKKKKKKTVQIADLELDGEDKPKAAAVGEPATSKDKVVEAAQADPVRPLEASADLTLKGDEPLDFSDLKKVHFDRRNETPESELSD